MVKKNIKRVSTPFPDSAKRPVVDHARSVADPVGRLLGPPVVDPWGEVLVDLGFPKARVRRDGDVDRIELPQSDIGLLVEAEMATVVSKRLRALGAAHVSVELI